MRRKCKKLILPLFIVLLVGNGLLFAVLGWLSAAVPKELCSAGTADMTVAGIFPVSAVPAETVTAAKVGTSGEKTYPVTLKLFGVIPISSAQVRPVEQRNVLVLGTPFGIKIYADGVMVVGLASVNTASGKVNPAGEAGIGLGDVILSLNGQAVNTNRAVASIVEKSEGDPIAVRYSHDGKERQATLTPAYAVSEQQWRIGLWVRDSSAGIGTLTFYEPSSGVIAGLGHGIADSSTGTMIPLASGEMVNAEILSVRKSEAGAPGELSGRFESGYLGTLLLNTSAGVYGSAKSLLGGDRLCPVALKQEITAGEAELLTTVEGKTPQSYACRVERIDLSDDEDTQDMIIRVTDPRLLDRTGGIVQGMSGSPILQNGKLIGAVTHVLVSDPTRGYAVFAETMLEAAESVASKNNLKDAS